MSSPNETPFEATRAMHGRPVSEIRRLVDAAAAQRPSAALAELSIDLAHGPADALVIVRRPGPVRHALRDGTGVALE